MRLLFTILFFLLLVSCGHDSLILAKVNGDSISIGDFKLRLKEIQFDQKFIAENELLSLKKNILNEMIEEKIIQQESKKAGIKVISQEVTEASQKFFSPQEIQNLDKTLSEQNTTKSYWNQRIKQQLMAEKLFESVTQKATRPTDQEMTEFYQKNPELFFQQEQVHIQQIKVKDKEQAKEIQKQLANGEDFAKLAEKYSVGDEGGSGGYLGFITKGLLPETLEKKVFALQPGTVSPILESSQEFYLIKVLEKKDEKRFSFEEARQRIESMLLQKSKEKLYARWLQEKTVQTHIKRNYELLQENIHL